MDKNKQPKKILIIEDDEFLRDFYCELLTTEGYLVETASDGETGLAKVLQGGWNLVLLDIMLPKKDGLSILREIQSCRSTGNIGSVLVLTNLGNDLVINQAFALGANGYLVKSSMNPDEVLAEIDKFLHSPSNA